jgi:hypothetical protein
MDGKTDMQADDDGSPYGFCLNTQKLHCLIVIDDTLGKALSCNADDAYFRAFVVEERETGEVFAKMRFRYTDNTSWMEIHLDPEKQKLSVAERVRYISGTVQRVMRTGMMVFAGGGPVPDAAVVLFNPPNPDDAEGTLEWLIQQDLVQITKIVAPDGTETIVSKEGHA